MPSGAVGLPQLRQDLITGRWVAVATERARRPDSFTQAAKESIAARDVCPFCPGHESMTPPEVLAYRPPGTMPNSEGWWIRVVPNLYAAFRLEPDGQEQRAGRFWQRDAIGACEVLISSPDHRAPTPLLPGRQVEEDRKSTRLNSSHSSISYAVFCLKKKIDGITRSTPRAPLP